MYFDILLADPAWNYNDRLCSEGRTVFGSGASGKYRTESAEAMAEFEVESLCAESALLFMWATGPFLPRAIWLMEQWSFPYISIAFQWVKVRRWPTRRKAIQELYSRGVRGFLVWMTRKLPGHYTASNTELVLLGRHGPALLPEVKLAAQTIYAPPMQHSRKPDDVHDYIEMAYPDLRYIELFARRTRPGWTCLGNEIDGRDLRESIPDMISMPDLE